MSGILEQMNDRITALEAAVVALRSAAPAAVAPANPFGGFGAAAPITPAAPPPATAESIMGLIGPHIDNEAIKQALGAEMRAMGINALPEAQPHQYPEMFQRFSAVIARGAGGAAPSNSII